MRTLREPPACGSPAARWRARSRSCGCALDADALDVYQPDVVLALGHLGRAHARRARAAAQPLVHAAHVDERDRAARQSARLRRRRRRADDRVPLRPAGVDAGAPRLHARRAGGGRPRRDGLRCPTRPGSGSRSTRRRSAFYAGAGDAVRGVIARVGFIGLGNMGGPMCGHLVAAGLRRDRVRPRCGRACAGAAMPARAGRPVWPTARVGPRC